MEKMKLQEKLANIQDELNVPKNQYNKFGNYYYRSCEDILNAVKPTCKKYRTSLFLSDSVHEVNGRYYIEAYATLSDWDSEEQIIVKALARESMTQKGMAEPQLTGASSSYARKYALNGLFCIDDTKDNDTEENKEEADNRPVVRKITAEQKDIIKSYINDFTKAVVGKIVTTTGKNTLNALNEDEATKVIEYLHSEQYIHALEKLAELNQDNKQVQQGLGKSIKYAQDELGKFKKA